MVPVSGRDYKDDVTFEFTEGFTDVNTQFYIMESAELGF